MPLERQAIKPVRLNTDKSKKYLSEDESSYLLNHDILSVNGKSVPLVANSPICEMYEQKGENYACEGYYSKLTNEAYSWVYNEAGNHSLQRVNGDGSCQDVYFGDCLNVSANPANAVFQWRAIMRLEKICHNRHGKQLIWVDGTDNDIYCLDVEASIATNNFTTPFFDRCPDPCAYLKLCVPDICECVKGEYVPLATSQASLTNHLRDVSVKIIVRYIYYDLRESEWSTPSTAFFQNSKGGCFGSNESAPRCLKLTVPLGNPLVDKIEIGYSIDNGASWFSSDTVEKYASYSSSQQYWYEREINHDLELTEDECHFYYYFCNDKQCQPISREQVFRVYNPLPREAQGLIQIKDTFGYYNYKQGNCPVDKLEIDKAIITPNCSNSEDCTTEYSTVKVRAIVHNFLDNTNEPIYREAGSYTRYYGGDDVADTAYFGGLRRQVGVPYYTTFGQKFAGTKRNFTAYIEGSTYSSDFIQFRAYQNFTQNNVVGTINDFKEEGVRNDVLNIITNGFYYYQEASFKVPKGSKGYIRLSSHEASVSNPNTSTFVAGTISDIHDYVSFDSAPALNRTFEVYFDTCNGDVDLNEAFIIRDHAERDNSKASHGVILDNSASPISGVDLYTSDNIYLSTTDYNGFYNFSLHDTASPLPVKVLMETSCASPYFGSVQSDTIALTNGQSVSHDIRVQNVNYVYNYFATVIANVVDCNGVPIPDVTVALSGAKSRVTDTKGNAYFNVRNYPSRARVVRAIVMDINACYPLGCEGQCNPCQSYVEATLPACFYHDNKYAPPQINLSAIRLNTTQKSLNNYGLKKGGAYEFGFVFKGSCGRISSVYPFKNGEITIPKLQDNGSEDFCSFSYDFSKVTVPYWATCIEIVRTTNLNPYVLQLLVDKIERTGDGRLKLSIQSLNDYKLQYNLKVNTIYQFQQGDRVEFIANGDGKIFKTEDYGLLNYALLSTFQDEDISTSTDADAFNQLIIEDSPKLINLMAGAKIEIQRAKTCTTDPVFYSICVNIPVEGGLFGTFETFDTFRVSRQLGTFPSESFEHFAPSDFWVGNVDDTGKAYFINKYENERRYGRNISLSSPTVINYFGDTVKTIDGEVQGDIIAMSISDDKAVLGICENDSFILAVADDLVRVSADGTIVAVPADRIIGSPELRIGGQFGCRYEDAGSIFFGESYALWASVKKEAYVKHNYNIAQDVTLDKEDLPRPRLKSFFRNKFRAMQLLNNAATKDIDKVRFITGINNLNNSVALTFKALSNNNISNQKKPLQQINETIIYHPDLNEFLTFASFTPEAYNILNLNTSEGAAFITYDKGVPYLHPLNATVWNEFFGIAVDRVVKASFNKFPEKIKVAISTEIQDETMWFVSEVVTDNPNYLSEVPAVRVKKTENKWNFSFLGNKKSSKGLYGKDQPRGYFIECTFIRDNTNNLVYNSIDNGKMSKFDELDSLIGKILISEQSGMSQNL